MGWQRSRISDTETTWCYIAEHQVRDRFHDNLRESEKVMKEMMETGKMKAVGRFWYRFVKD